MSSNTTSLSNPLFHIAMTAHSHLGAFATRDIRKGTTVLIDTPLFTLDAPLQAYLYQRVQSGASSGPTPIEGEEDDDEASIPSLEHWFEKQIQRSLANRTPTEIEHFYKLSNMHPSQPRAYAIFLTNAVSLSESMTGGLFPLLSRFNSSCRPNLSRPHWSPRTRMTTLNAVRDIAQGEEMVWPYLGIPFEFDPPESRRAQLKQVFGFECACHACLEWTDTQTSTPSTKGAHTEPTKLKASEARLRELRRLKQMIEMGGERVLRKMQAISKEEHLWEMSDRLGSEADRVARGEPKRGWDKDDLDDEER
ncbi:BQ2448_3447 [Microbotryum intermedium]|uniref:BQ2448_3447 protein n=1 Tax=Microbotryum intermedium TaxID=269621 RepID=A0A238FBW4_9BASI|nr:BQ2448_3447 [Microbotryum intermedium]